MLYTNIICIFSIILVNEHFTFSLEFDPVSSEGVCKDIIASTKTCSNSGRKRLKKKFYLPDYKQF